ncbi:MAG: hypothetical protein ACKO43_02120 [Alphaproteobacteria bacterium]
MSRPVPTTVTEQTLYDLDYLAFMASLLIQNHETKQRFQSGMALLATWFSMTAKQQEEDNNALLAHIKLQWWADTLVAKHHGDHPLLSEAPPDLRDHPDLVSIIAALRQALAMPPSTDHQWEAYLQDTFGTMGTVIYGKTVPSFSLWGWQKHVMRGDTPPNLWGHGPEPMQGDVGVMARTVRALGPKPKSPKRPWVLLRLWVGG